MGKSPNFLKIVSNGEIEKGFSFVDFNLTYLRGVRNYPNQARKIRTSTHKCSTLKENL